MADHQGFATEPDINELVADLGRHIKAADGGSLARQEATLVAQVQTLDVLFNTLARTAARQIWDYPETAERYMKLALRAQANCRATVETLAEVKNPSPVAFIKQANVSHGPQQVNNGEGSRASAPVPARESEAEQNGLLEAKHGQRLDYGTEATPAGFDSAMAAMGAVNRPEDSIREACREP